MQIAAVFCFLITILYGQQPLTLRHSIPPAEVGKKAGQFGFSVATDGTSGLTVVGAPLDYHSEGLDKGVVRVFDTANGTLLHVIPNPEPTKADQFGRSVAISGTRIVVGAYRVEIVTPDYFGSAYVYDLDGVAPIVPSLSLKNPRPGGGFGNAVGISGNLVTIGAPQKDSADDPGSVHIYDLGRPTPSVPVLTLDNPDPSFRYLFGGSVAISGTRVVVGVTDNRIRESVFAYVYDFAGEAPTIPVVSLTRPRPRRGNPTWPGPSVAISHNYVVVGAPWEERTTSYAGSAYIYDLTGETPSLPTVVLESPNPMVPYQFGFSVALSGDRVVVSEPGNGVHHDGRVYVYDIGGDAPVVTLTNHSFHRFGYSVAASSDSVIVGEPRADTGRVHIYDMKEANPAQQSVSLANAGPSFAGEFGRSAALSASTLVVGAPTSDRLIGSAHVFDLAGNTPDRPIVSLVAPDVDPGSSPNNGFGTSVDVSGTTVVIGNPELLTYGEVNGGVSTIIHNGIAYVLDIDQFMSEGIPEPYITLRNPEPSISGEFGRAVAVCGSRVVVGAPRNIDNGGAVFVYDIGGPTPSSPIMTFRDPSPNSGDRFGNSVAISGSVVVVGDPLEDFKGDSEVGRAYVYDLMRESPFQKLRFILNNPRPGLGDWFGSAVAISGSMVIIGANRDDPGVWDSGSAFIYDVSSATPSIPKFSLVSPEPDRASHFGFSVAISGATVAVGELGGGHGGRTGSTHVYDLDGSAPEIPVATLRSGNQTGSDQFAAAVAVDGKTIAVGAPRDDSFLPDKGHVYVYGASFSPPIPWNLAPRIVEDLNGTRSLELSVPPGFSTFVSDNLESWTPLGEDAFERFDPSTIRIPIDRAAGFFRLGNSIP